MARTTSVVTRLFPRYPHRLATAPLLLLQTLCLTLLLILSPSPAASQSNEGARLAVSDTIWEVHLTGGESYVGRVVEADGQQLTIETATGTRIRITRQQVARARPARGTLRGDEYWAADPNTTRLFFSPTGRTLEQGDGYLGVYELFVPFVAYGVTDAFMLAGGSPFYLALNGNVPPVYFGPKLRLAQTEATSTSVGALALFVPDSEENYSLGILYGASTIGDNDRAVTVGLGWGYVEDRMADQPLVMLGGEMRVGRRIKLLTENLFIPGETGVIVSGGVRFFGERLSADAGLLTVAGEGSSVWLPVVNFVYNFGPAR